MTSPWYPSDGRSYSDLDHVLPTPGTLVAHDRTLYRVVAVHERNPANWDENTKNRMVQARRTRDSARRDIATGRPDWASQILADWDGQPETWPRRPRSVEIQPAAGGKRLHLLWPHHGWSAWHPVDEHHPVCASCGDVYPCREVDAAKLAAREMVNVEKLMAIGPGCCWHCGQPITSRQAATTFPGDNLLLPGAPSPSFHNRRSGGCFDAAWTYEKRWRAANPDVPAASDLFTDRNP